jgi:hypothetical protein
MTPRDSARRWQPGSFEDRLASERLNAPYPSIDPRPTIFTCDRTF